MGRLTHAVTEDTGNHLFVLHGLGGCGKTAVAQALFRYATDEAARVGLWVNASDQTSLRAGMLAVAADRGAGEGEVHAARRGLRAAADLVWERLDGSDQPWLLVLDNADDPSALRDGSWLRTSARGTVLVTTRQAASYWWPSGELLHVGVLPRVAAAQVLRDLAPRSGTDEEAAEVADRLGRLPLALTLAGRFLAQQVIDPWTMTTYSHRLDEGQEIHAVDLLDRGAGPAEPGSRHLVSTTWQMSLDALTDQGVGEAVDLLRLLACLSSDPLPLRLLLGAELPGVPASRVEVALRGLLDHSLTELLADGPRCLRTHGVLLDSVLRSTPGRRREPLARTAGQLLLAALPEAPQGDAEEERTRLLAPHALMLLRRVAGWSGIGQDTLETATEAALKLVIGAHRAGDYRSALGLATEAVELSAPQLGSGHVLVLRLQRRMGTTLYRLGRFDEAEALHRQVLADCERLLGPAALDTLDSCVKLASCLIHDTGDQDGETSALIRRAVHGRTDALGLLHPSTLQARAYLLELLPASELTNELQAGQELLADCHRELGPDHYVTGVAASNYAYALYRAGRADEALPLIHKALAEREVDPGPEHPKTLQYKNTLAKVFAALDRHAEAAQQMEGVVEGRTRALGPTHPWSIRAQDQLARLQEGM